MTKDEVDTIIRELRDYIHGTYSEHYSVNDKIQVTDFIMRQFEDGSDFLRGNSLKYLSRYGIKAGKNRKDLLKSIHYIIMMMHHEVSNDKTKDSKHTPAQEGLGPDRRTGPLG